MLQGDERFDWGYAVLIVGFVAVGLAVAAVGLSWLGAR